MPDQTNSLRKVLNFRILGGLMVLVLIGAGVFIALGSRDEQVSANNNLNSQANTAPVSTFDARQGVPVLDGDSDGLTDEEESSLGTNPTVADSDRDELTDFDEAKLYHSDPKKADTDGDGNADGIEVKRGFSPTGAGKLYDTSPAVIKNATP